MIEKAQQVLKQFEAYEGSIIETRSFNLIQKRPEQAQVTVSSQGQGVSIQIKAANQAKVNKIYQKFEELGIQSDFALIKETGGAFKNFGEIDNVFGEGKTALAHIPGEVLLVDVWATWCGPCQKPMQHNQQMLEKNEGIWGDKVRIIGVSVDEEKEVIQQRVTNKKWEKITHLTLLGWKKDHPLIQEFKVSGIPFVCLVSKWGKINYVGHPSQINLEARINQLLSETEDVSLKLPAASVEVAAPNTQPVQVIEKIYNFFTKQNVQKEFKDNELACFRIIRQDKKEKGVITSKLRLNAYVLDGDHVAEELIKKIVGDQKRVELKIEKVRYVNIPQDQYPSCALCNTPGLKYPFYWLRWEEGTKFGCKACVEKKSQVEGHHHVYEKNSVLLLGKWDRVSQKDLGKNLQPTDVKDVTDDHMFGCNGCGGGSKGIGHARYISLGCRSDPNFKPGGKMDLCDQCIQKVLQNDEKVLNELKSQAHEPNHPFLRVLYNTNGYYEY